MRTCVKCGCEFDDEMGQGCLGCMSSLEAASGAKRRRRVRLQRRVSEARERQATRMLDTSVVSEALSGPVAAEVETECNTCVQMLLNGVPEEGGSASREMFERLIRMAFYGGVQAHMLSATGAPPSGERAGLANEKAEPLGPAKPPRA